MKEILLYTVLACSSLFIFGYSVHMLVGGMVSESTETLLITAVCTLVACVMAFMAWDVVKKRRNQ